MYRNTGYALFALFLILGSGACQSYDRSGNFKIFNRSNHAVFYWLSYDSSYRRLVFSKDYELGAGDSVKPYLMWGPEGDGPDPNHWANAINRADDSALHVFYFYIDYDHRPNAGDSAYRLIIRRCDYKVKRLNELGWKVEYR